MAGSRYFSQEGPETPHLAKGEVLDLRNDVEAAFERVEVEVDNRGLQPVLEVDAPAPGVNTAVVRVRFPDKTTPIVFELLVFDDADGVNTAINGTLDTATIGTILRWGGTAAPKVKTAADGDDQVFECTLTNAVDESNFLTAFSTPTGPVISCIGSLEVAFTPV